MITEINQETLKQIEADLVAALAPVAQKHGLKSLRFTTGGYSAKAFHLRLEGLAEGNILDDPYQKSKIQRACFKFGLTPDIINREFTYKGATWRVETLNPKKVKYPVDCINLTTNKHAFFPASTIKTLTQKQGG